MIAADSMDFMSMATSCNDGLNEFVLCKYPLIAGRVVLLLIKIWSSDPINKYIIFTPTLLLNCRLLGLCHITSPLLLVFLYVFGLLLIHFGVMLEY